MTTTPDPDALDAIVRSHSNRWYTRGCAVGRVILDLDPGEYRTRLVGYLSAPVDEVGHAAIIAAVRDTIGAEWRSDALSRHRSHLCGCSDEAWS